MRYPVGLVGEVQLLRLGGGGCGGGLGLKGGISTICASMKFSHLVLQTDIVLCPRRIFWWR